MKIYLIRHAQSLSNEANIWTGQLDIPLSPQGAEEQRKLCGRFAYPEAEIYFSSPLLRCTQSLEIIYGRSPDHILPEFSECSLGILEGKQYTNLDNDPNYISWTTSPGKQIEGGESFNSFTERVCDGFEKLLSSLKSNEISSAAGMMHGNVMRAILHRFADPGIPHWHWRIPNGGMYILDFITERKLSSWSTAPGFIFRKEV